MTSKQKTALALVAAAIVMLSFSIATKRWFQARSWNVTFNIGLLSVEGCSDDTCETASLAAASDDENATYVYASMATFALGVLSIALLLALVPLGIKRQAPMLQKESERKPAPEHPYAKVATIGKIALCVLILTVFAALVVMLKKPPRANASLGVFLFMIGGMAGVVGAQMLATPSTYEETVRDPSIPRL